jgi:hypothetical protein
VSLVVNLYIAEVRVLFAGHGTIEVQSRARLPGIRGRRSGWVWNGEAVGRCRDIKARVQT